MASTISNTGYKFSDLAKNLRSSLIRELLKYANVPGSVSFGGGVPDPETFPRNELAILAKEVIEKEYRFSLQYGVTEGDSQLRSELLKMVRNFYNVPWINEENILITVGSQEALELVGKVFLDTDSYFIVGDPIYLGAASAFRMRNAKPIVITLQDDGFDVDMLEAQLRHLNEKGEVNQLKFLYAVSNFQNPSGITISLEKRKRVLELADRYNFLIVEDDPYGALRYEGQPVKSMFSMGGFERVMLLNTFSKILCPGLRIGVVIADKEIIRKLVMAKQGTDLCSSSLDQRLVARYLQRYDIFEHIKPTIELYRKKRDAMLDALSEHFSDIKGVKWTKPQGGLFIWLTLPEGYDTMEMFEMAKQEKVFYIPGEAFRLIDKPSSSMRLSFCLPSVEEIHEGIQRLRGVVERYAKEKGL
ncbi:MAG: PLP-dependent aminotransferase family protein [Thermotogaceae bacterium]|nr:PLP-dependent aminotransferase family protein [Thermotogaceae bacterium]